MSAGIPFGRHVMMGVARGVSVPGVRGSMGVARLPTDSLGDTTITFTDIAANSEIRVYLPDGTEIAGIEDCVANQVLSWGVYASGSANNTVRIVVIHPAYRIKEFTYVASLGSASLPMKQDPDKWYSNPA